VFAYTVDPELSDREPAFVEDVFTTLNDPKGWRRAGVRFCPAQFGEADIIIGLALPRSVDLLCAPIETKGEVSCAIDGRAVINVKRWDNATRAWDSLTEYRNYVINHEVGHLLGLGHAKRCTASGRAPLMMQQSRRRLPCEPNGLPTNYEIHVVKREEDR
jgi:hypothetical protein